MATQIGQNGGKAQLRWEGTTQWPNGKAQLRWEVVAARWQPSVGTNSGGNPDQTEWWEVTTQMGSHNSVVRYAEQKVVTQLSKKL